MGTETGVIAFARAAYSATNERASSELSHPSNMARRPSDGDPADQSAPWDFAASPHPYPVDASPLASLDYHPDHHLENKMTPAALPLGRHADRTIKGPWPEP